MTATYDYGLSFIPPASCFQVYQSSLTSCLFFILHCLQIAANVVNGVAGLAEVTGNRFVGPVFNIRNVVLKLLATQRAQREISISRDTYCLAHEQVSQCLISFTKVTSTRRLHAERGVIDYWLGTDVRHDTAVSFVFFFFFFFCITVVMPLVADPASVLLSRASRCLQTFP